MIVIIDFYEMKLHVCEHNFCGQFILYRAIEALQLFSDYLSLTLLKVRNLGKPVELAGQYYKDGADEVSFLNITGFRDFPLGDLPMLQVLRITSENVFVPFTVGGGIRDFIDGDGKHYSSLEVASEYFRSGADKISVGSDAVYAAEEFIKTGVKTGKSSLDFGANIRVYGNQAVVVSIDPRRGKGFDIDLIKLVSDAVSIPVIASSGAGAVNHFSEVFQKTNASAALAAGIFHRKEVPIKSLKQIVKNWR
ncbi:unnamed protein product [Rhodiola kirilowii]